MAYSDFTLKKVKSDLNIKFIENESPFSHIEPIEISKHLQDTLKRNIPLALAINTEKARSELIIINVLLEIKTNHPDSISLFSGIDFNVDKEKGLIGFCDFIISSSPEQLYLDCPIIAIVERMKILFPAWGSALQKCMLPRSIMKRKVVICLLFMAL